MLRKLCIVLLSLAGGVALSEGVLRWQGRATLPRPDLYVLDPDTGKSMRPGWQGEEFGAGIVINSLGLRGPETSYEKPPGRYRILALGDSWTFGFRMQDRDSYPRVLENLLNERARSAGRAARYEVINAGVVGYATTQEAAYLDVRGRRFDPDLVLLAYYPVNDTDSKLQKYERYHRLRRIHPWLLELYLLPRKLYLRQFLGGVKNALRARWLGALEERWGTQGPPAGGLIAEATRSASPHWTDRYAGRDWELTRAALREIGEITRELGAQGLGVLLPDLRDLERYIERDHPRVETRIRAAIEEAGLAYLDLLPSFEPHRSQQAAIRDPGFRHPNRAGYRLIARTLADEIEARYLRTPGLPGVGFGRRSPGARPDTIELDQGVGPELDLE